ncbi:DUF6193 family natural product biosynthesis protein [Streptomyces phaeoluteigriseus]|uniref:DUF6193 family natural product biosynthesis protein n=1 Tax=Streptomyces phaeoluteigriseus TaxID=114686 RepID=A0ABY4ZAX0_9ACTN|nr:DUF6193 family natural product biosynthesis protein [Streptomyces phaeoluteigriseus]USQ85969.1 DUF6193 family natural product biosynthesis protein [Streptomyces phaeoluteigriseus]
MSSDIEPGSAASEVGRLDGCLGAVPVTSPDFAPLRHAAVASTLPHREPLAISAWSHKRRWSICGEEPFQSMPLIDGGTDDLAEVARAARAWHDGATLEDIRQAAPFVHLTGRFEVPDNDPARLTDSEWQGMRQEAAELEYAWQETYHNLIEAADADPALRALYPFTSHWALRFSTTTRPALTVVGPCLSANSDATYGVGRGLISEDLGQFATAQEAVAVAVRQLPPGLGPTTLGG